MRHNHNPAAAEQERFMASRTLEAPEAPEDHHDDDEQSEDHLRNQESPR